MNKRITVTLTNEEIAFIKFMAARDNVSVQEEMQIIFQTELNHLRDMYEDEMNDEIFQNHP